MGVIFLAWKTDIKIIAVGGNLKVFRYFKRALEELHTLATLLEAELHICFLDREAYKGFTSDDEDFLIKNILRRNDYVPTYTDPRCQHG